MASLRIDSLLCALLVVFCANHVHRALQMAIVIDQNEAVLRDTWHMETGPAMTVLLRIMQADAIPGEVDIRIVRQGPLRLFDLLRGQTIVEKADGGTAVRFNTAVEYASGSLRSELLLVKVSEQLGEALFDPGPLKRCHL